MFDSALTPRCGHAECQECCSCDRLCAEKITSRRLVRAHLRDFAYGSPSSLPPLKQHGRISSLTAQVGCLGYMAKHYTEISQNFLSLVLRKESRSASSPVELEGKVRNGPNTSLPKTCALANHTRWAPVAAHTRAQTLSHTPIHSRRGCPAKTSS